MKVNKVYSIACLLTRFRPIDSFEYIGYTILKHFDFMRYI